jgi:hypothetical protein
MTKRSVFLTVAAGLLASVAFATPSQAGTVLTTATFSVTSPGTATDVEVTYTPAVDPIGPITITSTGGLTTLSSSEIAANEIEIKFDAAPGTTGTLSWTFSTATPGAITFSSASLTGVTSGAQGTLTVAVSAVPEPTSMALLGIGMTGFLAFRRFFKRSAVA